MTLNAAGNGGNGPLPRTHSGLAPMPLNTASSCQPNSLATLAQRIHLAVSTGFLNPQVRLFFSNFAGSFLRICGE